MISARLSSVHRQADETQLCVNVQLLTNYKEDKVSWLGEGNEGGCCKSLEDAKIQNIHLQKFEIHLHE